LVFEPKKRCFNDQDGYECDGSETQDKDQAVVEVEIIEREWFKKEDEEENAETDTEIQFKILFQVKNELV